MKEILFRGKTTGYPSKWVYGFPYIDENKQEYLIIEKGTANRYFVMPETISMFTGLFDRNGNKIFEYDVLETQEWHTRPYSKSRKSKRFTGIVVYHAYIGHNFYNKETDEFNRTCSISAKYRVRIIEEDELDTYRYSTSGEFFDCAVIGDIFDDNYLENNPKAVSILNAWKANPFDNFTRSLTDKESEIYDNLINTQNIKTGENIFDLIGDDEDE